MKLTIPVVLCAVAALPLAADQITLKNGDRLTGLVVKSDEKELVFKSDYAGEVKVPAGTNPADERKMLLSIANRPSDNNTTYVTGGDVSRFQRRTVPGRPADAAQSANAQPGSGNSAPSAAPGQVTGPVVRVARGNSVTVVPVGAR